jgi:hypothetical protein
LFFSGLLIWGSHICIASVFLSISAVQCFLTFQQ